jgi:PAS domain S-box-containing protein
MKFRKTLYICQGVILTGVLVLALLASAVRAAEREPLVFLGDDSYPPMTFQDKGEPKGVVIDILHALEHRMGRLIEIRLMKWQEAQALVALGKADALCQMSITDARRQIYDFSEPVLEVHFSIFASTGRKGIVDLTDLHGLRVGVTAGGLPRQLVEDDPKIRMTLIDNYTQGFLMLRDRKLDAVVADQWAGSYILAELGITDVQIIGNPVARLESAIAVKKGNAALLIAINEGLKSLQADGTLDRINAKWRPKEMIFQTREQAMRTTYSIATGILVLSLAAATIWLITMRREIAERKRTEEALFKSERRFRILVDTIPDLIWLKDADGVYLSCNRMFERFFGAREADIVGKTDYDFVSKELADSFREHDLKAMAARNPSSNEEWITFADDGHQALLDTTKAPMYDSEGKLIGVLGVGHDITKRKRTDEENAKLEAQLQQAQKMESVGRLAGGVAHDFNNMLSVILGHANLALMELDSAQPLCLHLQEISKAAERSADLTRQLLAFARKQTIAPKVLDLNVTVASMLNMLQRIIGEDINLKWQPEASLWPVKVDPSQIDQILANLCVNARDSIVDVGKITIETANCVIDEGYCAHHAGFVAGEYVRIAVSDNGCGMDKETLSRIFEPFFTTKGAGEGTGLGLSTVYGATKQNNGYINVYSEPGLGTTFAIYLPRYQGEVESSRPTEAEPQAPRGEETILIVEDERAILELASMILGKQGYCVLVANSPGEAIRLAEEYTGDIHLLMTDVVMPEMNGLDLAKKLRSLYPQINCLFMSGYTANVIAHHGVLDEGVHFIQKPFSIPDLAAKVREVLESKTG